MKQSVVSGSASVPPADSTYEKRRNTFDVSFIEDRKRFQSLLFTGGGAVVVLDERGHIRYVAPPAKPFFHGRSGQINGQPLLSFVHQKDLFQVINGLSKVVSGKRDRVTWLFRLQDGRGRWRWLKAVALPFRLNGGRIVVAMLLQDFSEL